MDEPLAWKTFFATFGLIFLAELGDKTQLAALSLTAGGRNPWIVFCAAALALILVTALGVAAGTLLAKYLKPEVVTRVAGGIFVIAGIWMIWKG